MNLVVYIDVFFLVNFFIDFFILLIMKALIRKPTTYFRVTLSAAFGSFAACLVVMFQLKANVVIFLFMYAVVSLGMVLILFGIQPIRKTLEHTLIFYLIACCFGGILYFLYNNFLEGTRPYTFTSLLCFGFFTYFIVLYIVKKLKQYKSNSNKYLTVDLCLGGIHVKAVGLLDTGNQLREPITKKPVIVVEYDAVKECISDETKKIVEDDFDFSKKMEGMERLFFIPYHSLGSKNSFIYGMKADYINIFVNQKKEEVINPMIGLYKGKLSVDGTYQFILHEEYINS